MDYLVPPTLGTHVADRCGDEVPLALECLFLRLDITNGLDTSTGFRFRKQIDTYSAYHGVESRLGVSKRVEVDDSPSESVRS
jgi:hypothetical protein